MMEAGLSLWKQSRL